MKKLLLFLCVVSLLSSCIVVQPTTPCQKPKRVLIIGKQRHFQHHPHRRHP